MACRFAARALAALAVSTGCLASTDSCDGEVDDAASLMMLKQSRRGSAGVAASPEEIYVQNENAPLHAVLVGTGNGKQPDETAKWLRGVLQVLPEGERAGQLATLGTYYSDTGKTDAIEKENDELIEILEKLGVKVYRPASLSNTTVAANFGWEWVNQNGYAQVFARDPIFVVGDNIIENMMSQPNRRVDLLGISSVVHRAVIGASNRVKVMQMPVVNVEAMTEENYNKFDEPHLEGGDLLVFNESVVLAGVSANKVCGSSTKGVEWLQSVLPSYTVKPVRLVEKMLHLDCAMSIPKPGVSVICKECIHPEDYESLVNTYLKGYKLIEVTLEQGKRMQTNGLPVNEQNYILGFNNGDDGTFVKKALEKEGIAVHLVNFTVHNSDGGSIRCATHPLLRKS